jgi:hypothetical protein
MIRSPGFSLLRPPARIGDWRRIAAETPTSDVSSVVIGPGLSAYSQLEFAYVCQLVTSASNLNVEVSVDGSTGWRSLLIGVDTAGSNDAVSGWGTMLFGSSDVPATLFGTGQTSTSSLVTPDGGYGGYSEVFVGVYSSYVENADYLRFECDGGNIEGSNAAQRGLFLLYGLPK